MSGDKEVDSGQLQGSSAGEGSWTADATRQQPAISRQLLFINVEFYLQGYLTVLLQPEGLIVYLSVLAGLEVTTLVWLVSVNIS